jgi:hypothetical protein
MCELLAGKTAAPLYADEGNLLATKPKPVREIRPQPPPSEVEFPTSAGFRPQQPAGRAGLGRAHSRNKAFLGLTQ